MAIMIDEHNMLSNKFPCMVNFDGIDFPSAEAAFQSTRFPSRPGKMKFTCMHPFKAEYEGRRAKIRIPDWENKKNDFMYQVLCVKFSDRKFRAALLDTGDEELVITNLNHEHEWGTCACFRCGGLGKNNLGKMLMELRAELSKKN